MPSDSSAVCHPPTGTGLSVSWVCMCRGPGRAGCPISHPEAGAFLRRVSGTHSVIPFRRDVLVSECL